MRTCKKCGFVKNIELFRKATDNRTKRQYFSYNCLDCARKKFRKNNPKTGKFAIGIGISRGSKKYKIWRENVLARDNYKCIICNSDKYLHCDHIKPWKDFPNLRFEVSNGQTLCACCHIKKGIKNNEIDGSNTQFKNGQKAPNPFKKGHISWLKGTKGLSNGFTGMHSDTTKEKISKSLKLRYQKQKIEN